MSCAFSTQLERRRSFWETNTISARTEAGSPLVRLRTETYVHIPLPLVLILPFLCSYTGLVIVQYLTLFFPTANLRWPQGALERKRIRWWASRGDSDQHQRVTISLTSGPKEREDSIQEQRPWRGGGHDRAREEEGPSREQVPVQTRFPHSQAWLWNERSCSMLFIFYISFSIYCWNVSSVFWINISVGSTQGTGQSQCSKKGQKQRWSQGRKRSSHCCQDAQTFVFWKERYWKNRQEIIGQLLDFVTLI